MHNFVVQNVYGDKLNTVLTDCKGIKNLKSTHIDLCVSLAYMFPEKKTDTETARPNETHPTDVKFNLMASSKTDGLRRASDLAGGVETTLAQSTSLTY